jgi:ATP-binding cassette, subfamily B, multidrug efflux pump
VSKPRSSGLGALRALLPFIRPYRTRIALGLLAVAIGSAIASAIPWQLRRAIDDFRSGAPSERVLRLALAMVAVGVTAGAFRFAMRQILNSVSRWVEYDVRNAMFRHLLRLDAGLLGRYRTGDLMARLTNDISAVRMVAGPAIMYFTNTLTGGMVALVFMLRISPSLTAFALLPMVLLPVVMAVLGAMIHTRFEAVQEHFGVLTTHAQENISGARVVRAYRQEAAELARFSVLNDEYLRRNMGLARLYGLMSPGMSLLAGIGAVVVLGVGGRMALSGRMTIGEFVAFGIYLAMLTWPLIALGWVINLFQRGSASMGRLNELLQQVPQIASSPDARTLPATTSVGRSLAFRQVSFHYPPSGDDPVRPVLREISFVARAGQTVGIVGATGSGKSALMDLIPRLRDPSAGDVLVDGIPIRSLTLASLRGAIGYVPQDALLFSETIEANLTYGGADIPAAHRAAAVAQLDAAMAALPDGYATLLGERGINLSGGQKQRATIARALARDPQIVLLDDALSAVDTNTEAAILAGLRTALRGRTAIIASHRVSAVRDADWILVLDDGRIVEQGTHDTLFAQRGRYFQLLRRQQLGDDLEALDSAPPALPETHAHA